MRKLLLTSCAVGYLVFAGMAFAQNYDQSQDSSRSVWGSARDSWKKTQPSNNQYFKEYKPAINPYDQPTLGDSTPRLYGKKTTLGDSRSYRKTSPRTCRSLLCD